MGDQIGEAVSGSLNYVPYHEIERILSLTVGPVEKAVLFAAVCRINTLYMIACAGSGHIGSSFSSMDIMAWLHLNELRSPTDNQVKAPKDFFFSSKGHDAPALYNIWIGLGKLDFELIHQLRRIKGLPGHPDVSTPNVVTNTGSLGMGISKAKGIITANRLNNITGNVFVLTGDGELQEGQFWESLISAANRKLHELTVIIDHNKLQSDTLVSKVSDLGDLEAKLSAFGWHISRCDGNDLEEFSKTLANTKIVTDKPKIIIADTIKGKGVSFMEHTSIDSDVEFYKFHSGAPAEDAYVRAAQELIHCANAKLAAAKANSLELKKVIRPTAVQAEYPQRLISAYSIALLEQARKNVDIVALDADLVLDTGLIPFQREFPERFIECGIAEQDMVSQAGGLALRGKLPIVHSFACFLTARANEQIYNNASEKRKVIYVGSLAGVLPAGPGHSHQAVRDIALIGSIPGIIVVEPCCESEVRALFEWSVTNCVVSVYFRIISVPWVIPFKFQDYTPVLGRGVSLRRGRDILIISYGIIMVSNAYLAAESAQKVSGLSVGVVSMPWLNILDEEWLYEEIKNYKKIVVIDNHYLYGGLGDRIASALAKADFSLSLEILGIKDFPPCGSNDEALKAVGLDVDGLVNYLGRLKSETTKN